jgi:hypothetical protein
MILRKGRVANRRKGPIPRRPGFRAVILSRRRDSVNVKKVAPFVLLVLVLSACAGPGGVAPSGGLMYRLSEPATAVYVSESTSDINIDAGGMGSFGMLATSDATLAASFSPGAEGVEVTVRYERLSASMTQPMGGAQTASERDVQGELVFTLDRRGNATVVSLPTIRPVAEQLVDPLSVVHGMFPRLPGEIVRPGATWTDTIQYETRTSQGDASSSVVMTYTLQGDTLVDGSSLVYITYEGRANVRGTAMTEGMQVLQSVSGTVSGILLWDAVRSLLVADEGTQDMTGSVEVPAAGMPPMPLSMRGTSSVRLQDG